MKTPSKTKNYMLIVTAIGFLCLITAIVRLPLEKIDLRFLFLAAFTVGLGSRITVQIPKFKSHISVSDTFIFFALLFYGGEAAVVLAAIEAFCSAWRFCNKKITVFFNAGAMALSTTVVVAALQIFGIDTDAERHGHTVNDFVITLSLLAFVQFF